MLREHGGQRLILKRQLRINGSRSGIRGPIHDGRDGRASICRGVHGTICHNGRGGHGHDARQKLQWM
jgi:hypothetical protein